MSSELRQRSVASSSAIATSNDQHITMNYDEALLSAQALQAASPTHTGSVMKIHIPALYTFLPSTVQWFISTCCPIKSWSPSWKRRNLIAIGSYVYRYKDENGISPKGMPIPVATTEVRMIPNHNEDDIDGDINVLLFDLLPEGYNAIFEISSIGKTQYFATTSKEEASIWVNSLKQMRQDAISRTMGHSQSIPYPKEWKSFDTSAKRVVDQKTRIRNKLEAMEKKEMEMQGLSGGGGGGGGMMGYYS